MTDKSSALKLDHITIVAKTLEIGITHVRAQLGIDVPVGGNHPAMGTHNCLMKIGNGEFLEIIAINPDAELPNHPRWFGLDQPLCQNAALATWVLGTGNIHARANHGFPEVGAATRLTRSKLEWLISVAPDGELPMGGAFPTLIEWAHGVEKHPAENMQDKGIVLTELTIKHPRIARVEEFLSDRLRDPRIQLETGHSAELVARFRTPWGERTLR